MMTHLDLRSDKWQFLFDLISKTFFESSADSRVIKAARGAKKPGGR